jgi:molecular chaperone IbpA
MRTIDFSPLYRSVVGFDRLAAQLDAAATQDSAAGYPPYNIERTDENAYRVEIAVAGFRPDELTIEVKENLLTVTGRKAANDDSRKFLHRGLAERNFERRFQLADYVLVTDANLADGLLSIALKRELPEALKPRTIGGRAEPRGSALFRRGVVDQAPVASTTMATVLPRECGSQPAAMAEAMAVATRSGLIIAGLSCGAPNLG